MKLTHELSIALFCNIVITKHMESLAVPLPNNVPFNVVSNLATLLRCRYVRGLCIARNSVVPFLSADVGRVLNDSKI